MHTGTGHILELVLQDRLRHARIACPTNLIPAVGQYLLASRASDSPLPVPLYYTDSSPQGFLAAPAPDSWNPGDEIALRGALGRGFSVPAFARKIALVAFGTSATRLRGLIALALKQGAAITLVTDAEADHLPDDVEVQPLSTLAEVIRWADWIAVDVARDDLPELKKKLGELNQLSAVEAAQCFVQVPVPCGGIAECGVCAVGTKSGWKMGCKDGPVFPLREL